MISYIMEKFWDMTIDFLAKVNTWIPLVTVLWAGLGIIGVVLILAITGYALRKRLVQQWIIWTYFIFATIIIFAQADGDIFTVVAHMEVPCLVVLLCYFLRLVFYRRPRYTYVERAVYAREIDKTPIVKEVKVKDEKAENTDSAREVETTVVEEVKVDEVIIDETKKEDDNDQAEVAFEVAEVETQVAEKNDDKAEVEAVIEEENKAETKAETKEESTEELKAEKAEEVATVDMPVVEPIPDKAYEAPREPGIVTTPVSETIPELKSTIAAASRQSATVARPSTTVTRPSTSSSIAANRSTTGSSLFASRSTASSLTSASRPAATTTSATSTAARPNAFASMYNPRTIKTTTTTTTTTNTSANTLNATSSSVRASATSGLATGVNRTASTTATTGAAKNPRSTDDIMAAIARLRASMKK